MSWIAGFAEQRHKGEPEEMDFRLKMARVRKMILAGTVVCMAGSDRGFAQGKDTTGAAGTAAQTADAKEWPTFGHDSGGCDFLR